MYLYNSMLCPNGAIQSINHFLSPDIQSLHTKMLHHLYILPHIPDLNWPSYKKLQEAHPY